MAKAKKKAEATVVTLTEVKGNGKHVAKLDMTGYEGLVPVLRKMKKEIDDKQTAYDGHCQTVREMAGAKRYSKEVEGEFYKTVVVKSEDGNDAEIVFKNAFAKLEATNEPVMRAAVGELFDELFVVEKSLAMRPGTDLKELQAALGDKFWKFFDEKAFLAFKPDFMEKRAEVRKRATPAVNNVLDGWVTKHQAKPDFRLGK